MCYFSKDLKGPEGLDLAQRKCHKEDIRYFSKDLEGPQLVENGPGGLGPKNYQMS